VRAVLDIGSNTIRLLVAEVQDGAVEPVLDESDFVRLGLDVDRTGMLRPDREEAALAAIQHLAAVARDAGVQHVDAIATSAVREATNGRAFVALVRSETGIEVEIISGDREAYLTYLGATAGQSTAGGVIVADLGGGSTELIAAGERGMLWAESLPLGSGRLTERFIRHDPPAAEELQALRQAVVDRLQQLPAPIDGAGPATERGSGASSPATLTRAIFTGGTASAMARLAGSDGPEATLDREALDEVVRRATSKPAAEIADEYGVRPERAVVLAAGVTALATIAEFYGVPEVSITRGGIREGALLAAQGA